MRKTTNIVTILTFWLLSCNQGNQTTNTKNVNTETFNDASNNSNTIITTKSIDCNEFSETMTDFIELLKQDNYAITSREEQSELWFKSYKEEFQIDKTISFPRENFKTIFAKRKNKLERMSDNWYPSFSVTEICFQDKQSASKSHKDISEIIDNSDLFNEKDYDYIIKNGNRLIYVNCGAKIFAEFAFTYKDKIEEIIKINKR